MLLPWHLHRLRLKLTTGMSWLLLGFLFTLLLATVAPMAFGMHPNTVRSGSMTPAIRTGDVVVSSEISPAEARVGDIITFEDPEGTGHQITHRVRTIDQEGAQIHFITRGDANNNSEHWTVPADGTIGRVTHRVPLLGFALAPLSGGSERMVLVVLPALLLCVLGLIRIWSPDRLGVAKPVGAGPGRHQSRNL